MKNKLTFLMVFGILSLVAILGLTSAAITLTPSTYSEKIEQGNSDSFDFIISNADATRDFTDIVYAVSDLTGSAGTISSSKVSLGTKPSLVGNLSDSSSIAVTISPLSTQAAGVYTGTINISGNYSATERAYETISLSVNVTSIPEPIVCAYGNDNNNLRIRRIDFTNDGFLNKIFGKSSAWFPLDKIKVEITIEDRGDDRIEDIEVEWGLYDPSRKVWVIELDDENTFDLRSGRNEVVTLSFVLEDIIDVDLEDLRDGDYDFYVRAIGYDREYDENICAILSKSARLVIEDDFVVIDRVSISDSASCGSSISVSGRVWNIGDRDQEDVYLRVYNQELGIDQKFTIGDVDAFDYRRLNIVVDVPGNVKAGTYSLGFAVYDEDDEVFRNDYGKDDAVFTIPVEITCADSGVDSSLSVVVSASLVSGGQAGKELVVKSTIVNLESNARVYTVGATGYSDWASSLEMSEKTFVLSAGESKSISLTFDVKDSAQGSQYFDIEVYSENKLVTKQPVSVSIDKKGFSFSQFGDNKYLWGIAILNIILVILIIIVAVKVLRK